jgi:hypothetical protein
MTPPNDLDMSYDPRAALEITRYHTWRTIRRQSNGEHSCQVMRIMLTIWPSVPRTVLFYAVFHDIGEVVGDIPYPFKRNVPELADGYKKAERQAILTMRNDWEMPGLPNLSLDEEAFFKMCEFIEMMEFGMSEVRMGNLYAKLIVTRCQLGAVDWCERYKKAGGDPNVVKRVQSYIQLREDREAIA